ncbi:MAG: ABC transporter ATP-binding protein [Nitrososphaeria archaeon]|nr:ABC transporter ATP-binding protein [Nitrososphaeria archaeon]
MNMEILKAMELTKIYKGGVKALDNVSFDFYGQGVFTILGRNGAGKTTFLRIIGTQLLPSKGKAYVLGYDVVKESKNVRKNITVMPQEGSTLPPLTPWDHVYYTLRIRGFSKEEARENALEALSALELLEYKDVHADQLSGGLRQRTLVAMAMATKSKLLLLDEPTLGLDPLSRRNIWKVIREYCKKYGSIILTTHYLDEAEILSDDIVILNNGKVIAKGSVEQLKSEVREKVKVEVYNGFTEEELRSYGRIVVVGDRKRVLTDEKSAQELVKISIKRGVRVQTSPITLDDVFVDLAAEGE